jgi:hypothetical protein
MKTHGAAYGFTNTTNPASTDPVIRSWDNNTFFGVDHRLDQVASHGWDLNASSADPLFLRAADNNNQDWNRSCTDYAVHSNSPAVTKLGFRPIDMSAGFGSRTFGNTEVAGLLRVDAVKRKVQAERYQRMRGLWREGSLGIGNSGKAQYKFDTHSWARFDYLDIDCAAPCQFQLRVETKSATGTAVKVSLGDPSDFNLVAEVNVSASTTAWTVLSTPVLQSSLNSTAQTLFLRLNGTCRVDWFRFKSGE